MRRWTKLALCVLALGIIAAPAPAQKILGDSSVGYNLYAHNWQTLHNGMDLSGGNYVNFFGVGLFGGNHVTADSIRKCWNNHYSRGHQESVTGGTNIGMWNEWIIPGAGAGVGFQVNTGTQTVFAIGTAGANGDFCLAPYTANTYFLLGGFQVPPFWIGAIGSFAWTINWRFVKGGGGQGSRGVAIPNMFTLNNGTTLLAEMVYDLQHGYNSAGNNLTYIGTVSVDELTYPVAGGIAGGDNMYGSADWFGYVNNGGIVSYTRVLDVLLTNNGGFVGLIAYPGQSAEGNYDGFETLLSIAGDHGVLMMGRNAGEVALPDGTGGHYYGAGGHDWVSCGTSTSLGSGENKFQLRHQDLYYSQFSSPLGVNDDPATDNSVEIKWSLSAPTSAFNTSGSATRKGTGEVIPLDHGMGFDFITGAFDGNPKAIANIKFTEDHMNDNTTSPFGIPVAFEGNWVASSEQHPVGTHTLERGKAFGPSAFGVLSLCHPKAVAQITTDRTFYLNGIMRTAAAGTSETGIGWTAHETGNVERAPVAAN